MRVLLDVDGVVSAFDEHLIDSVGSSLTPMEIVKWDIFDLIAQADNQTKKVEALMLMDDPEFWATLPVKKGALEGVESLRNRGADVYWVTTPWWTCRGWDVVRRQWLVDNFPQTTVDHVVITSAKYLCAGDIFVDDKVDNVDKWVKHNKNGRGFIYSAPYNKTCTKHEHVTWDPKSLINFESKFMKEDI